MSAVERNRKIIAPVVGVAVAAGLYFLTNWWWLAILAALLVTGALWVMFAPEGAFDPRRREAEKSMAHIPPMFREEIQAVPGRLKALRTLAYKFGQDPLRDTILQITEHAKAIHQDVEHQPRDYNRMRKALTHYLDHVENIGKRLAYMAEQGQQDEEALDRSRRMLGDLVPVFQRYRDKMMEDDVFDIDSRLTLLEQEIGAESITAELQRRSN